MFASFSGAARNAAVQWDEVVELGLQLYSS